MTTAIPKRFLVKGRVPMGTIADPFRGGKLRTTYTNWRTYSKHATKDEAAAERTRVAGETTGAQIMVIYAGSIVIDVDGKDLSKIPRRGFPKV